MCYRPIRFHAKGQIVMKIYDSIIDQTIGAAKAAGANVTRYNPSLCWPETDRSELVMQRDAAFELGGSGKASVNYTCVTTEDSFDQDEIWISGTELKEIKGDVSFGRVVILKTDEFENDETAFAAIRDMEFTRYHVFPKGYMVRVSSTSFEERVRVSKEAVKEGISLSKVGASYIKRYKAVPGVKNVRIIFFVDQNLDALVPNAKKVEEITKALTHILDGLPTDCGHCSMKKVCDEVEGMKEMHLRDRGRKM